MRPDPSTPQPDAGDCQSDFARIQPKSRVARKMGSVAGKRHIFASFASAALQAQGRGKPCQNVTIGMFAAPERQR